MYYQIEICIVIIYCPSTLLSQLKPLILPIGKNIYDCLVLIIINLELLWVWFPITVLLSV